MESKSIFKTKQDLFDALIFTDDWQLSEFFAPFEYLSTVKYPEDHDMKWFVKQAGCIKIYDLWKNLNIDCITNEILIDYDSIESINNFLLGSDNFFSSVQVVTIDFENLPLEFYMFEWFQIIKDSF